MKFAITIGAYRLLDFIELNITRCSVLFGESVPILISDDLSPESPQIRELAARYQCHYMCGQDRRSHFSGDIQAFINALVFCRLKECDVALKISQRFVPVLPQFKEILERAFSDSKIQVAVPGQLAAHQIARPAARFYKQFGILTDMVAMRNHCLMPEDLLAVYRARFQSGRALADSLVETTWGWLLENRFKDSHVILPELANHVPFQPKIYLRKSQSLEAEYQQIGKWDGVEGKFDVREWGLIEGPNYRCRPNKV